MVNLLIHAITILFCVTAISLAPLDIRSAQRTSARPSVLCEYKDGLLVPWAGYGLALGFAPDGQEREVVVCVKMPPGLKKHLEENPVLKEQFLATEPLDNPATIFAMILQEYRDMEARAVVLPDRSSDLIRSFHRKDLLCWAKAKDQFWKSGMTFDEFVSDSLEKIYDETDGLRPHGVTDITELTGPRLIAELPNCLQSPEIANRANSAIETFTIGRLCSAVFASQDLRANVDRLFDDTTNLRTIECKSCPGLFSLHTIGF